MAGVTSARTPRRYTLPGCRARTASGHATTVPPSSVMNCRRLIIGLRPQAEDHTLAQCGSGTVLHITAKWAARLPRWVKKRPVRTTDQAAFSGLLLPQEQTCG